jgi:hypothetical protein
MYFTETRDLLFLLCFPAMHTCPPQSRKQYVGECALRLAASGQNQD